MSSRGEAGRVACWWRGATRVGRVRARAGVVVCGAVVAVCACVCVAPGSAVAVGSCPNEALRVAQASPAARALPECRAYELVSPADDHPNLQYSAEPYVGSGMGEVEAQAAGEGGAIVYRSWYSPAQAPSEGHFFRSVRGAAGWATSATTSAEAPVARVGCFESRYLSETLSSEVFVTAPPSCQVDEPALVAGEPRGSANLFVREAGSTSYRLVNLTPVGVTPADARFQAGSADMSRVVFDESAELTPGAPRGDDLYDWADGVDRLVTYLPSGVAVQATLANGLTGEVDGFGVTPATLTHAISASGERVVFVYDGSLYLRENAAQPPSAVSGERCTEAGRGCTVELDRAQPGASGVSGGGEFLWADGEGTRVFFADDHDLTLNATAELGEPDLYEYSTASGLVTDLTPHSGGEPADVQGVAGAGEDGSYLYFVADGVLAAGARKGQPNLYLRHEGTTALIGTLNPGDSYDWGANAGQRTGGSLAQLSTEVSRSGTLIAFNSIAQLTRYDNMPENPADCSGTYLAPAENQPCDEIFVYDAASKRLACVSCGPGKSAPTGIAQLRASDGSYPRHALGAEERVFFDTPTPLLSQDARGVSNVYEWTAAGVGECEESSATFSATAEGCVYSISSGTSTEPSYFVDASESGEDVYFVTSQSLLASDTDNGLSLYDARVDGGFQEPQPPTSCEGEACRGPAGVPPPFQGPSSAGVTGSGNLTPSPLPAPVTHKTIPLTRRQKLRNAIERCKRKPRNQRRSCEEQARRDYRSNSKPKQHKQRHAKHATKHQGGRS